MLTVSSVFCTAVRKGRAKLCVSRGPNATNTRLLDDHSPIFNRLTSNSFSFLLATLVWGSLVKNVKSHSYNVQKVSIQCPYNIFKVSIKFMLSCKVNKP